jgi:hypothetical protein
MYYPREYESAIFVSSELFEWRAYLARFRTYIPPGRGPVELSRYSWTTEESGINSQIIRVGDASPGVKRPGGGGLKLITYLHLLPRLRMVDLYLHSHPWRRA